VRRNRPTLSEPRCPLPTNADMICWPSFANRGHRRSPTVIGERTDCGRGPGSAQERANRDNVVAAMSAMSF
jgi:hypothetical protein